VYTVEDVKSYSECFPIVSVSIIILSKDC